MSTARWTAFWAAIPLVCVPLACFGMDAPQQRPEDPQAAQQKAVLPATPADATDPAKMAAPGVTLPTVVTDKSYIIGAEDVLTVQIWGDPRLSGSFLVRPDGRISMNLIGEVMAMGQTPLQLETAIGEMLKGKEILNKPQVTVQVTQINSKKYYILGEVLKPGPNPLLVPTRILEALVNAGGFKDFANPKKIEVVRGN